MKKHFWLAAVLYAILLSACGGRNAALPTPVAVSPSPTATKLPTLTPSLTPSPTPTLTPTLTPTPGPYVDIDASPSFALTYARAEWEQVPPTGNAMLELHHKDFECSVRFLLLSTELPPNTPQTKIYGYPFLVLQQSDAEWWVGPMISVLQPMTLAISPPTGYCKQAVRGLLQTLHLSQREQERCSSAYFETGMTVKTVDYVYIRSEPRWAEETRLKQLQPGVSLEIIDGPVCAPYDKGIYVYWQVRLPNGSEAWIAEGDPQGPYIAP